VSALVDQAEDAMRVYKRVYALGRYCGFSSHSSSLTDTTKSCRYYLLCKAHRSDNNALDPSNNEAKNQRNVEMSAFYMEDRSELREQTDTSRPRIATQRRQGHLEMLTGSA